MREIQKYHDGRYRSIDAVYLCGEIGNPDKERAFVPLDRVLEIIDKVSRKASAKGEFWTAEKTTKVLRRTVEALRGGDKE